jgi:hypothetical protein
VYVCLCTAPKQSLLKSRSCGVALADPHSYVDGRAPDLPSLTERRRIFLNIIRLHCISLSLSYTHTIHTVFSWISLDCSEVVLPKMSCILAVWRGNPV